MEVGDKSVREVLGSTGEQQAFVVAHSGSKGFGPLLHVDVSQGGGTKGAAETLVAFQRHWQRHVEGRGYSSSSLDGDARGGRTFQAGP